MARKKLTREQWIEAATALAEARLAVRRMFNAVGGLELRTTRQAADLWHRYTKLCWELRQAALADYPQYYEEVFQILEKSIMDENKKIREEQKAAHRPNLPVNDQPEDSQ